MRLEHEKRAREVSEKAYWRELEHLYAGMAMQSLIMIGATKEDAVIAASDIATALVENLKKEEE